MDVAKAHKYKRATTPKREQMQWATSKFCEILERIDNRCMAADGPVTDFLCEASSEELRLLYRLAKKISQLGGKVN